MPITHLQRIFTGMVERVDVMVRAFNDYFMSADSIHHIKYTFTEAVKLSINIESREFIRYYSQ